jgi:hypothetical protein
MTTALQLLDLTCTQFADHNEPVHDDGLFGVEVFSKTHGEALASLNEPHV